MSKLQLIILGHRAAPRMMHCSLDLMRAYAYPALFRSNKEDSVITLDDWIRFFVAGLGLTASIYVIMQVVALAIARGKSRYVVLVPLVLFLFSLYATADAYRIDSNLWPLPML